MPWSDSLGASDYFGGTSRDRFYARNLGMVSRDGSVFFCPDDGEVGQIHFEIRGLPNGCEPGGWAPGDPQWTLIIRDKDGV